MDNISKKITKQIQRGVARSEAGTASGSADPGGSVRVSTESGVQSATAGSQIREGDRVAIGEGEAGKKIALTPQPGEGSSSVAVDEIKNPEEDKKRPTKPPIELEAGYWIKRQKAPKGWEYDINSPAGDKYGACRAIFGDEIPKRGILYASYEECREAKKKCTGGGGGSSLGPTLGPGGAGGSVDRMQSIIDEHPDWEFTVYLSSFRSWESYANPASMWYGGYIRVGISNVYSFGKEGEAVPIESGGSTDNHSEGYQAYTETSSWGPEEFTDNPALPPDVFIGESCSPAHTNNFSGGTSFSAVVTTSLANFIQNTSVSIQQSSVGSVTGWRAVDHGYSFPWIQALPSVDYSYSEGYNYQVTGFTAKTDTDDPDYNREWPKNWNVSDGSGGGGGGGGGDDSEIYCLYPPEEPPREIFEYVFVDAKGNVFTFDCMFDKNAPEPVLYPVLGNISLFWDPGELHSTIAYCIFQYAPSEETYDKSYHLAVDLRQDPNSTLSTLYKKNVGNFNLGKLRKAFWGAYHNKLADVSYSKWSAGWCRDRFFYWFGYRFDPEDGTKYNKYFQGSNGFRNDFVPERDVYYQIDLSQKVPGGTLAQILAKPREKPKTLIVTVFVTTITGVEPCKVRTEKKGCRLTLPSLPESINTEDQTFLPIVEAIQLYEPELLTMDLD